MSAYVPDGSAALIGAAVLVAGVLALAFTVVVTRSRVRQRITAAWVLVVLAPWAAHRLTLAQPPGFRMLVVIAVLLVAMKAVVTVEAERREGTRLPPLRWLAFALLWPGMRPAPFARRGPRAPGGGPLVKRGVVSLAMGAALVALARWLWTTTGSTALATCALLPGLSLVLHFGMFGVVAGLWRWAGIDVGPLFRAPLHARSLGEFWSRRWNVAFSEMTSLAVYGPLAEKAGRRWALLAGFVFSGLLHELAVSLPVRAGYGGPMAFFALQGLLTLVERETRPLGRVGTLVALVLPLPLLFHPPFLRGVVWPLLGLR
ncbi:MAG TPA: membrane bound O-acyl transferase family-domain-containing protein [Vicinamibacteria bacterium]|nr:membrane bound O-acyl transferase family-domain-containing protein [Vicinamibacteria bacterium]